MTGREGVEDLKEFVYLGTTVTKEGSGTEDVKKRLSKAQGAFFNLKKIWNTQSIGRNTKIKLFKTLVRPVLLYGCEAWKLIVAKVKKLDRFQLTHLRRILRIWWPQRIRNDTISQLTGVKKISDEIRRRRWNWIGHVLRKERNDDCMVAMEWQPDGMRKVGRPKTTWRRTVEKESRQERWTSWVEVRGTAQDRASWRGKLQPYAPHDVVRTNS